MSELGALLSVRNLVKTYESADHPEGLPILDELSLTMSPGSRAAVMGPSGSGKSTLLHVIGGLDRPDRGSVELDGVDLYSLGHRELARVRNREIGFVFQHHHLLPQCTVLENVLLPALVEHRSAAGFGDRAVELLEQVGLADRMSHRSAELSGGERQRVAGVRALLLRPKLLLADEPTGSLDAAASENLARLLVSLNEDHAVSLLVATHSEMFARSMQELLMLQNGRLEERA